MGKRGRPCTICQHPERDEINSLLASTDANFAAISRNFAGITDDALKRHKELHIPELLSKSNDIKEIVNADSLLLKLQEEAVFVREMRDSAKAGGDIELALKAVDRALKCIELYAKVQGLIQEHPTVVNITLNAEWISLRTTIITALEPFPDARRAVIDALP